MAETGLKISDVDTMPTTLTGTEKIPISDGSGNAKVVTPNKLKEHILKDTDATPTAGSTNPVQSGGVAAALASKASSADMNAVKSEVYDSEGNSKIANLSAKVNGLVDNDEIVDLSLYAENSGYPVYNEVAGYYRWYWSTTDTSKYKHIAIPVAAGDVYQVDGYLPYILLLTSYSGQPVRNSQVFLHDSPLKNYGNFITIPNGVSHLALVVDDGSKYYNVNLVKISAGTKRIENKVKRARFSKNFSSILDCAYSDGIRLVGTSNNILGNSIAHFKECYTRGFKALKADMRLSSDNKLILAHSCSFTLDGDGHIVGTSESSSGWVISSHTAEEAVALSGFDGSDWNAHPCTLDEFLIFCKTKNIKAYLTLRTDQANAATIASIAVGLIELYDMVDDCVFNLFPYTNGGEQLLVDKNIAFCITLSSSTALPTADNISSYILNGAAYMCIWGNENDNYNQLANITPEMWKMAKENHLGIISLCNNDASKLVSLRSGIVGFQNYTYIPVCDLEF